MTTNVIKIMVIGDVVGGPGLQLCRKWIPLLKENALLPASFSPNFNPVKTLQKLGEKILGVNQDDPWVPDRIDYLHDFR